MNSFGRGRPSVKVEGAGEESGMALSGLKNRGLRSSGVVRKRQKKKSAGINIRECSLSRKEFGLIRHSLGHKIK